MQQGNDNSSAANYAGAIERLRRIEATLNAMAAVQAPDATGNAELKRAIKELAQVRADLGGTGAQSATGVAQSQGTGAPSRDAKPAPAASAPDKQSVGSDASMDASVNDERMKRALSELKSGEFDVQG